MAENEISFTKVALPYGWLGNMAPFPVSWEGKRWGSTEALFQALRFSEDSPIREKIRAAASPFAAKLIAKKHAPLRSIVPLSKEDLDHMRLCLYLKYEQHEAVCRDLMATETATLIEDCTARPHGSGKFWGAVRCPNGWDGQNWLGKLWMELRQAASET